MGIRGELFTTQVPAENRTYFFNVKENRLGDVFLQIVESKNTDTPDVLPASRTRFSCLQTLCDEGAYFLFGGHNAERTFFFGYEGSCGVCKKEHGAQAFFCKIGKTV